MKFAKRDKKTYAQMEHEISDFWKSDNTFKKSVDQRPADNSYVFYDGPPFITGVPHYGTLLSSIAKDAVPRYWTMHGKRVERVWGWDCHGLPAENFVEKTLGIKDKRDIERIGLKKYIETCRALMVQTGNDWEDTVDRIGRWVDFTGAYKTMDKDYMESVWWAFKQLYDKGKIYEGEKVLLYCTHDGTPLSKAEIAMDNSYLEDTDPSVYVRFKVVGEDYELLAWTTTPWTLPANVATAVHPDLEYVVVEHDGKRFVVAKDLAEKVFVDEKHQPLQYNIVQTMPGLDLIGKKYEPLFANRGENAHRILSAPFVTTEEGTGVVHMAPAYGEEDYDLAKKENLPIIIDTDENGFYTEGNWKGHLVWDINKQIAKDLHEQGVVWRIEYIRHSYPHCYRCGTKLMYRAHPSWFMDIGGQRELMLDQNENINWYPDHIKHGRFEHTVATAPDWNLSRDRFWATAMPIWRGTKEDGSVVTKVVGSYSELKELSGAELDDYHRPYIDEVEFEYQGTKMKRIDKVLDCWFESGSMPFAQFHYPFENKEKFEANFPGDFIVEYVGQVRAWFYYLHTVSVGLFGREAFKHVIVTGTLAGNDGRKMSKSLGNFTDPSILLDQYSSDALRMHLLASPVMHGEDFALVDKDVADMQRHLNTLRNSLDFFLLYAEADNWEASEEQINKAPDAAHVLDKWILARLLETQKAIEKAMRGYDTPAAIKPILELIEDLSNWYVRRNRRRFWKSENDADKDNAYCTLYFVLCQSSKLIAPFAPFLADEIYRALTGQESVHLTDWPEKKKQDSASHILLENMKQVRELITQGLAQRAAAGIKVRQPLAKASLNFTAENKQDFAEIFMEELNVKEIEWLPVELEVNTEEAVKTSESINLDTNVTHELKEEGIARELVRVVQNARKNAGFNVDDRIKSRITSESQEVVEALSKFKDIISAETLSTGDLVDDPEYNETVKVEGQEVVVSLSKAR
jgi:isoleucyl-tRNA synthetase